MSERRYAVLIANSQFPREPKLRALRAPENDVDGMNEMFASKELGDFTEISVLKNESSYDAQRKIFTVLKKADKNDFVVIYYSGHGKLDPAGALHLATNDTEISALEVTSIPVTRIHDFVETTYCNKVALILDCCYSGAAGGAFARGDLDEQLQLVSGGRGIYIITASTAIQIAQERETDQYGLFTKNLIEGIRTGEADLDEDGNVSMDELYRYVHKQMLAEGFQEPMRWSLNVGGDIFIARTGKSPREARRRTIRELLARLANEDRLPDAIVTKAWEVIHEPSSEASDSSRRFNKLLDQLVQGRLLVKDFIGEWYKAPARSSISQVSADDGNLLEPSVKPEKAEQAAAPPKEALIESASVATCAKPADAVSQAVEPDNMFVGPRGPKHIASMAESFAASLEARDHAVSGLSEQTSTEIERRSLLSQQSLWKLSDSDRLTAAEQDSVRLGLQQVAGSSITTLENSYTKLSSEFLSQGLSIEQSARIVNEIAQRQRRRSGLASSILVLLMLVCSVAFCALADGWLAIFALVAPLMPAVYFFSAALKLRKMFRDGYTGYEESAKGELLGRRGDLYFLAKDYSNAFCWFYKAAEAGDARSAYILGTWYERGGVVTKNVEEARRWYEKAAKEGKAAKRRAEPFRLP